MPSGLFLRASFIAQYEDEINAPSLSQIETNISKKIAVSESETKHES